MVDILSHSQQDRSRSVKRDETSEKKTKNLEIRIFSLTPSMEIKVWVDKHL